MHFEEIIKDNKLMFRITPDDDFAEYSKEQLTDKIRRLRGMLNLAPEFVMQEKTIYIKVRVKNIAVDEKPYITYVKESEYQNFQEEMHSDGNPMTSWGFEEMGEYKLSGGEWIRL